MPNSAIFATFTFIFFAALPGRTTFLMLLMAARGRPWTVFIGASLAFVAQSAISVGLGHFLAFLPPRLIQFCAGLLFIYFAFHFWREGRVEAQDEAPRSNTLRSVFLLVFMAEWGDVSQVAIASMSARNPATLAVFFCAAFALCLISALAVFIGTHASRAFKQSYIQRFAALVFAITGIYLLIKASFVTVG